MKDPISQEDFGLLWRRDGEILRVVPWGPDGVRIQATRKNHFLDLPNALLNPPAPPGECYTEIGDDFGVLRNGKITVHLAGNGKLSFRKTSTDTIILEEWDST
jgi:alpha-D-xyloside xylohydrolase